MKKYTYRQHDAHIYALYHEYKARWWEMLFPWLTYPWTWLCVQIDASERNKKGGEK